MEYFRSLDIPSSLNEATDYETMKAFDIIVGNEAWDVKADYFSGSTRRIFIEAASLQHTKSDRFAYFITTPYGFDIRIFTVSQLIELYNAKVKANRGDGTFAEQYLYKHQAAGDQPDNVGAFIPLDVVKQEGLPPYLVAKELRTQTV